MEPEVLNVTSCAPLHHSSSSFMSTYKKDNIFCALEELRLRRATEIENTSKINSLLKEKYELCCQKEEILCQSETIAVSLRKQNEEIGKKLADAGQMLQVSEERKQISAQFDIQGTKSLKDEIISQQLARHGLERKLKEQECQLEMHFKSEDKLNKRVNDLEERFHFIERDRDTIQNELHKLESSVQKASLFQTKIMRINRHQKCNLEMYKEEISKTLYELTRRIASFHSDELKVEHQEQNNVKSPSESNPKQALLMEKLEAQLAVLKKEKIELLDCLSKQSNHIKELSTRLSELSTSEMLLYDKIHDLQAENKNLKETMNFPIQDAQSGTECKISSNMQGDGVVADDILDDVKFETELVSRKDS